MKSIELKSTTLEGREAAELEVRLLSSMRHPNIVTYRESFVNGAGHLCIFMEYCEHGDVYTYLQDAKKHGSVPEESRLLEWFVQISLALHALHLKKILHRDLKTQNIFLTGNKSQNMFALKLGDFGIATVLDSTTELAKTQIGTPFYMSPELINNKPYSYKSDIWGLGCVLYEIVNGQRAFDAEGLNGLALKIIKGNYTPITSSCSPGTRSLIKSMLNKNPKHRPTLKEILHMSSIRPRIPLAQRDVISAGPQESRAAIEHALNNQLATLGLGNLVNYSGAAPKRDKRKVLQMLERAKQRKKREEEQLQRTAALLAQCLQDLQEGAAPSAAAAELEGLAGAAPLHDSHHWHAHQPSFEFSQSEPWNEDMPDDSQEETLVPAMSHRDRILLEKERRREEAQRRFEEEARKIREENLAHQRARVRGRRTSVWTGNTGDAPGGSSSSKAGSPHEPRMRARTKETLAANEVVASARDRATTESWLHEHGRHGPRAYERHAARTPRRRPRAHTDDPSPPPALYQDPQPPHKAPPASGSRNYVGWRSAEASLRAAQPLRQPMHSVCLEALDGVERLTSVSEQNRSGLCHWCSDDSYSSESLSELEEGNGNGREMDRSRQGALQTRIDQCRSAIYRHRMTIAMLQYAAAQDQDHEALGAEQGRGLQEAYVGSGDEGPATAALQLPGAPSFMQEFVARLQRRCLEGLGIEKFRAARQRLRRAQDSAEVPDHIRHRMLELLGMDKIGFLSLLDQLVHMGGNTARKEPPEPSAATCFALPVRFMFLSCTAKQSIANADGVPHSRV
eukprot:CAMPEP_0168402362 /NCGR_PEP_ID=MMETSP0228-20121227/23581_1 /TAXON_ID=133427 /ORGANISM="Protoceratium reticulatum, Strain CCCM 535 (=CCMP 1889)" /LENGTH=794 /DNA_ID=CAMNT_0008415945 /DNA_START=87 /DNA_END=2469 /DNA_ORIENTATION=+